MNSLFFHFCNMLRPLENCLKHFLRRSNDEHGSWKIIFSSIYWIKMNSKWLSFLAASKLSFHIFEMRSHFLKNFAGALIPRTHNLFLNLHLSQNYCRILHLDPKLKIFLAATKLSLFILKVRWFLKKLLKNIQGYSILSLIFILSSIIHVKSISLICLLLHLQF